MPKTEIIVPASTSNLGASFDTCGLALSLYLRLEVEPQANGFQLIPSGEGAEKVPLDESNIMLRAALYAAEARRQPLPGARIRVHNEIPLARGLGSSSAAIIAGLSLYETLSGDQLSQADFFDFALHFEGHGDNLAPSTLGGLVVAVVKERIDYAGNERRSLLAVKRDWPEEVKIVICIPDYEMETVKMRAVLPKMLTRADAIYNLQRGALLQAALAEKRFELINEALRDRLHQPYRAPLAAGIADVLKLNDETDKHPGLLGVAISGAGSTMIAFVLENGAAIAQAMQTRFTAASVTSRTLEVSVDNRGRQLNTID
jgi:homoserine kinase